MAALLQPKIKANLTIDKKNVTPESKSVCKSY